jgi:hypothetical protein
MQRPVFLNGERNFYGSGNIDDPYVFDFMLLKNFATSFFKLIHYFFVPVCTYNNHTGIPEWNACRGLK